MPKVVGYCPACGRTALFLGVEGHVTCGSLDCPRPDAADEVLDTPEIEHVVTFDDDGFAILHPLRERPDDALLDCDLHTFCNSLAGPPVQPGKYRAVLHDGIWAFAAA